MNNLLVFVLSGLLFYSLPACRDEDPCEDNKLMERHKVEIPKKKAYIDSHLFVGKSGSTRIYQKVGDTLTWRMIQDGELNSQINYSFSGGCSKPTSYSSIYIMDYSDTLLEKLQVRGGYIADNYEIKVRDHLVTSGNPYNAFLAGGIWKDGLFSFLDVPNPPPLPVLTDTIVCFGNVYSDILICSGSRPNQKAIYIFYFAKDIGLVRVIFKDSITDPNNIFRFDLKELKLK